MRENELSMRSVPAKILAPNPGTAEVNEPRERQCQGREFGKNNYHFMSRSSRGQCD